MKKKVYFGVVIFLLISAIILVVGLTRPFAEKTCPAIQNGLAYLDQRYNPKLGLFSEAPIDAPDTYWLTNDNTLAAFVYAQLGQASKSAEIKESIRMYGSDSNGLIEVMWGVPVSFPPAVEKQIVVAQDGDIQVKQELHFDEPRFNDWAEYANLGFFDALNEYHRGHRDQSLAIYANTLAQFDGIGFKDKAYQSQYETYKLALALFTGKEIRAPIPDGDQMLGALLEMQSAEGGFYTHYMDLSTPQGDTNTETTSLAMLALHSYGCTLP